MNKYYIKNRNTGCYVVETDLGTFYKLDIKVASKFTLNKALKRINNMKHPEYWELIKIKEEK